MIKIGRFEIIRDGNNYTLAEIGTAISRDTKKPKEKRTFRYYSSLEQCLGKIIDISAADAESAEVFIDAIQAAKKEIILAITGDKTK